MWTQKIIINNKQGQHIMLKRLAICKYESLRFLICLPYSAGHVSKAVVQRHRQADTVRLNANKS